MSHLDEYATQLYRSLDDVHRSRQRLAEPLIKRLCWAQGLKCAAEGATLDQLNELERHLHYKLTKLRLSSEQAARPILDELHRVRMHRLPQPVMIDIDGNVSLTEESPL